MSDRRNRPPNRWGCKPTEDVCVEHDSPLICRHGCDEMTVNPVHEPRETCAYCGREWPKQPDGALVFCCKDAAKHGRDSVVSCKPKATVTVVLTQTEREAVVRLMGYGPSDKQAWDSGGDSALEKLRRARVAKLRRKS